AGRVTRRSDGSAIAGALVAIAKPWSGVTDKPATLVTTDSNGRWDAPDVAPGAYLLTATAPGFLSATLERFELAPGEGHTNVELALDAGGAAVSGTIADINGSPIAGARVIVHATFALEVSHVQFVTVTRADGGYRLDVADGSYQLEAAHDDYMPGWQNV